MPTIASFSMAVALPATVKGTHMSRFVELIGRQTEAFDPAGFRAMAADMLRQPRRDERHDRDAIPPVPRQDRAGVRRAEPSRL